MIVGVDSSALFAIFKSEPTGSEWVEYLGELQAGCQLVACDIVWAEVAPMFRDMQSLHRQMTNLGVAFSASDEAVCFTAGQLFSSYRRRGGGRDRMIPDFIIAAHAMEKANGLATADVGYMREQFPKLKIFQP